MTWAVVTRECLFPTVANKSYHIKSLGLSFVVDPLIASSLRTVISS